MAASLMIKLGNPRVVNRVARLRMVIENLYTPKFSAPNNLARIIVDKNERKATMRLTTEFFLILEKSSFFLIPSNI